MRSPFQHEVDHFAGGKGRSFRHIINLMPPHQRYIETHLGGGAVLRNKLPARTNIGIDLDERVISRWKARRRPDQVILHGCVLDVLPALSPGPGDLVYADPPYLAAARRSRRYYRHDYEEGDHRRLLELLRSVAAMVVVSGYPSALYDELLAGWTRTDYLATTHKGTVVEAAWTNFIPGPVLHDYRYVGDTFRDRERFRRRSAALVGHLHRVGDVELNAALASLAETRPGALLAAAGRIEP